MKKVFLIIAFVIVYNFISIGLSEFMGYELLKAQVVTLAGVVSGLFALEVTRK